MARENKKKREAKRFGVPERLADKIGLLPLGIPDEVSFRADPDLVSNWKRNTEDFVREAGRSVIVRADNVLAYYVDVLKGAPLDWSKDIPSLRLPFPSVFIEMSSLGRPIPGYPDTLPVPRSWGFVLHEFMPDGSAVKGSQAAFAVTFRNPIPDVHRLLWATLIVEETHGFLDVGRFAVGVSVNVHGEVIGEPSFASAFRDCFPKEFADAELAAVRVLAAPAFLAVSFMNCKNVSLIPVDPPVALNRVRHEAGRKPFLRYHTINIEPMKAVLRTEGGVDSHGLRRALHICRGHFATYSEEKPLFGRIAGTVWRPAHVRGSAKQGVVFSDYRVNAHEVIQ